MADLADEFDKAPDLAAAFDAEPEVAPETSTPAPHDAPGAGETFLLKANDALPLGRQISAGVSALGQAVSRHLPWDHSQRARLTPQAAKELGMPQQAQDDASLLHDYQAARDLLERKSEEGAAENPRAALAGTLGGTALTIAAPLPKFSAAKGAGALARIGANAGTAAAYGALNSAANSKGDLTKGDVGQVLSDAVGVGGLKQAAQDAREGHYGRAALDTMGAGGIGGGLAGGALGGVVEGGKAILSRFAKPIEDMAVNQGRRVLTNGADSLSKRAPVSEEAVKEAIRSGGIAPFGTTKGALERIGNKAEEVSDEYSNIVAQLEAKGVKGPDARAVADELMSKGAALERNTMNDALPREYMEQATKLLGKATPEGELGLTQSENLKRSLQKMAKYGRVEDTELNNERKAIAAVLRRANEGAIDKAAASTPTDAELLALADKFVPVKQRLGNLLQAEEAATRGAARGAQRGHFGLKDTIHAASAVAAGHPGLAPVAAVGSNLLHTRAPSAVASYGLKLADALAGRAPETATSPSGGLLLEQLLNGLRAEGRVPALASEDDKPKVSPLAYGSNP